MVRLPSAALGVSCFQGSRDAASPEPDVLKRRGPPDSHRHTGGLDPVNGAPGELRTLIPPVKSRVLCRLSYQRTIESVSIEDAYLLWQFCADDSWRSEPRTC